MELIKVFLDNLYPDDKSTPTNTDALHALEAVNEEYLSRVLPFEDYSEEFLRLYDSAVEPHSNFSNIPQIDINQCFPC